MKYLNRQELTLEDWLIVIGLCIGMVGATLGIGTIIFYIIHSFK